MNSKKNFAKRLLSMILAVVMVVSVAAIGVTTVAAYDVSGEGTKTIYFTSNGYWTKFFALFASSDSNSDGSWYTLNKVSDEDDLYYANIPESYNKVTFCSRSIPAYDWNKVVNKTDELTIPDGCNYLTLSGTSTAMWSTYKAEDDSQSGDTPEIPVSDRSVYFVPNEEWMDIQYMLCHDYALRAWNSVYTDGVLVQMELVDGDYGI